MKDSAMGCGKQGQGQRAFDYYLDEKTKGRIIGGK